MSQKTLLGVCSLLFLILAVLHLFRLINGWPANIGTVTIPMWVSWIALPVAAFLTWSAYRLMNK